MIVDVDKILKVIAKITIAIAFIFIFVFFLIGIRCCFVHMGKNPPVEENTHIDSLITTNDSIKIKVENLDSIKNAKVIEVASLNNDSTIKLFYELVSE